MKDRKVQRYALLAITGIGIAAAAWVGHSPSAVMTATQSTTETSAPTTTPTPLTTLPPPSTVSAPPAPEAPPAPPLP